METVVINPTEATTTKNQAKTEIRKLSCEEWIEKHASGTLRNKQMNA